MKNNVARAVEEIEDIVGSGNLSTDEADIYAYSFDASVHSSRPDAVARPSSVEEVSQIMSIAYKYEVPVTPRGAGTSLCGASLAWRGGILLDMTRMRKVKDVRIEDLYVVVEPGLTYREVNEALEKYGFFFPPDPASGDVCTIGGMVGCNASGAHSVKYGATRDHVLGLEVVLADGRIVRTGSRTLKHSSGYQLAKLFVGSEGTLGVVTEATIKVTPLPEYVSTLVAFFDRLEEAGRAISSIISKGLIPYSLEIMDNTCIRAAESYARIGLPTDAEGMIIVEFDGKPSVVSEQIDEARRIVEKFEPVSLEFSDDPNRRMQLWKARKSVLPALSRLEGGLVSTSLADDMVVPMSKIADALKAYNAIAGKYDVVIGLYGHAGDGNLHAKFLLNVTDLESWKKAFKACWEIYERTVSLGGALSGEHGVGFTKSPFMKLEHASDLDVMRIIKKALDPKNILNPGKLALEKDVDSFVYKLRYPVEGV